jgi:thiol-disulfide isomerase/thioredoxin
MKKIIFLFTLLAVLSCKKEPAIDYAIISGTIENAKKSDMKLYNQYTFEVEKVITLDEKGSFKDTITIDKNNLFSLSESNNTTNIFLKKGSEITISYNANDYKKTIAFSGNEAISNKYFTDRDAQMKELFGDRNEIYKKEEADFKKTFGEAKNTQEDLLFGYEGLTDEFKENEKNDINYSYLSSLNNYESYHSYYAKKEDFKVSDDFLKEIDNVEFDKENDFLYSVSYRGLIGSKIRKEAMELIKKDSTLSSDIVMLKTISKTKNERIKNKLLYDEAKYGITYTDELEDFYAIYKENSTDEKNNAKIEESYLALKKLSKGSASPQFTDYENYAGGTTSLKDLKGKYVYIDVWATWCGPCIAEIPSLKKLEKEYHGKNIQFLSISIDTEDAYDKWKEMVKEKELGGIQLMADNNWESKFVEDYMIKGIPKFILLDTEGNIIEANAPRPSDENLIVLLNNLNL